MSSFACTLLLVFGAFSFKEVPAEGVNDCPRFDCEYKLLERLVKTENVQKEMETTLFQLQKEVRALKTNSEGKDIEIRQLLDNKSKWIESKVAGFSVSSTISSNKLSAYQLLVFDYVIYDPYQRYDRNTGIYTVPVSGTYLITGSILSIPGKRVQTEIIAGGRAVTHIYAYSSDTFDQGANSVVVDLKAGNNIFMRVDPTGSDAIYGEGWPSMSAICLKPA